MSASFDELGVEGEQVLQRHEAPSFNQLADTLCELPELLSPAECEVLIEAARGRLAPSTVVLDHQQAGAAGEGQAEGRTSSNVAFDAEQEESDSFQEIAAKLHNAIEDATGLPSEHQEPFQIVHYGDAEKYDQHFDAFDIGSEHLRGEAQRGGQRLFSCLVYLNDVEEGGQTSFPHLDITVQAEAGKCIYWPNVVNDGRRVKASLHASLPVTKGEKWVLVCWVREGVFGQPLQEPSISDRRGLDAWLEPRVCTDPQSWIIEQTNQQTGQVPWLRCGGRHCRGFQRHQLEEDVYQEILQTYRSITGDLRVEESEAIGTFISTVRPEVPPCLHYEVPGFNALVLDLLKPLHEAWCRFPLEPAACYGFRTYLNGAFLHSHLDRQHTHVVSSSICVDLDLYAPWPLELRDAEGQYHQLSLNPGEIMLYESASVLHGRPTPLNGRYHVGLFVHYRPAEDYDLWIESPLAWYEKHWP